MEEANSDLNHDSIFMLFSGMGSNGSFSGRRGGSERIGQLQGSPDDTLGWSEGGLTSEASLSLGMLRFGILATVRYGTVSRRFENYGTVRYGSTVYGFLRFLRFSTVYRSLR